MNISVVIPTYNRAGYLALCLDAILGQTLLPGEIIVVDDGSSDNTAMVLEGYVAKTSGMVRFVSIPNSGDLNARQVGSGMARGHLLAYCDSDDLWMPSHLEQMASLWDNRPDVVAAYSNFVIIKGIEGTYPASGPHGKVASKFDDAPAGFWDGLVDAGTDAGVFDVSIARQIIAFQPFFPSAMVVNREAFMSLGGWDIEVGRTLGGDFATALRVATSPPLGIVKQATVAIRKHQENRSGDVKNMNLGDSLVLEHVLRTYPALQDLGPVITASIVRRRSEAFDAAFASSDYESALDTYKLLPAGSRSRQMQIKSRVAALPDPVRSIVQNGLTRVAALRSKASRARWPG